MFSQRKSFWKRRWFILTIIAVLGAGYWFSQADRFPPDANPPDGGTINQKVDSEVETPNNTRLDPSEDVVASPPNPDNPEPENFFLIKEVNDIIEIYYYKGEGEPIFIKNADIAFPLLSEGDQAMFSEGIIVETEEELDELLQDFGS
jgi:hypothetical protein